MSKKGLFVADLHVGDQMSVMPDKVETDKTTYKSNSVQKFIYKKWEEMCDDVGRVDFLGVVGDTCEGVGYKSKGKGCWTTDLKIQGQVATELLKMIKVRNKRRVVVQGSLYHVNENMSSDEYVADLLEAEYDDEYRLEYEKEHKAIHMSHFIGVSSSAWMYRSTPIAREALLAALGESDYGVIDVIIRAHAHYYWSIRSGSHIAIILPCWKGRDSYVKRRSLAYNPHLGYTLLKIDADGIEEKTKSFKLKGEQLMKVMKL